MSPETERKIEAYTSFLARGGFDAALLLASPAQTYDVDIIILL